MILPGVYCVKNIFTSQFTILNNNLMKGEVRVGHETPQIYSRLVVNEDFLSFLTDSSIHYSNELRKILKTKDFARFLNDLECYCCSNGIEVVSQSSMVQAILLAVHRHLSPPRKEPKFSDKRRAYHSFRNDASRRDTNNSVSDGAAGSSLTSVMRAHIKNEYIYGNLIRFLAENLIPEYYPDTIYALAIRLDVKLPQVISDCWLPKT